MPFHGNQMSSRSISSDRPTLWGGKDTVKASDTNITTSHKMPVDSTGSAHSKGVGNVTQSSSTQDTHSRPVGNNSNNSTTHTAAHNVAPGGANTNIKAPLRITTKQGEEIGGDELIRRMYTAIRDKLEPSVAGMLAPEVVDLMVDFAVTAPCAVTMPAAFARHEHEYTERLGPLAAAAMEKYNNMKEPEREDWVVVTKDTDAGVDTYSDSGSDSSWDLDCSSDAGYTWV